MMEALIAILLAIGLVLIIIFAYWNQAVECERLELYIKSAIAEDKEHAIKAWIDKECY